MDPDTKPTGLIMVNLMFHHCAAGCSKEYISKQCSPPGGMVTQTGSEEPGPGW